MAPNTVIPMPAPSNELVVLVQPSKPEPNASYYTRIIRNVDNNFHDYVSGICFGFILLAMGYTALGIFRLLR
uniref:Adhesin n=1 Tax=Panagrellus redivivus TaxID=6233 RepID=A0A7E4VGU9_PANRE